eukprot:NODE_1858_length_1198_cov_11.888889_g1842_i0.p3 GENE.NODE_1858_length_1198_cov_11.888889_g1842_i0~~NODE_1858_length_1198_cov_11.888889_g1842_i0.p3  ORF type:complete len:123 (-),score=32.98 NODE_1858_length_1198_cov_11.888889_g1842_i0:829-1170(-)
MGIHTGMLCGAVVGGEKRVVYDVFGDTVNMASRMMTSAEPGTIQASAEVADVVRQLDWDGVYLHGPAAQSIKGKGLVQTYVVSQTAESPTGFGAIAAEETSSEGSECDSVAAL